MHGIMSQYTNKVILYDKSIPEKNCYTSAYIEILKLKEKLRARKFSALSTKNSKSSQMHLEFFFFYVYCRSTNSNSQLDITSKDHRNRQ